MKLSTLTLAATLLAPALAVAQPMVAQPGYAPVNPNPPTADGFHDRGGRLMLGFSLGLGGMKVGDQDVTCSGCDYDPIAGEFDFHIGGMLNKRLAIMFEAQGNAQTVQENAFGATSLVQASAMVAVQYWLTPQLWIKGGLGGANLGYSYDDGYSTTQSDTQAEGGAAMGAIGYELLSARTFSIDAQARMIVGSYDGGQDLSSGSIGVGFNWF
ncbi:MAG: hypothetical protein R3B06_23525 [Kofleriaceae bacterium]